MKKNTGRLGICENEEKSLIFNFQICPQVKKMLYEFCTRTSGKRLKSLVINRAIKEYIERERSKENGMH